MRNPISHQRAWLPAFAALALALPASGEEGMWLFNDPPVKMIKDTYGLSLGPEWFDHVQKSAVRFNDGGSGSFVSAEGLALTNHHVASGQIDKLSTPEHNYQRDGFLAKTQAEELACPDLELLCLQKIEDVSAKVKAAIGETKTSAEADAARKKVFAQIEEEAKARTGLHCEVVTLYGGGMYHLYEYHRYTDVRLVFAPEEGIAFLGGDVDNFEFPRFNLDMALVRVQDGKPIHPEHYLHFSGGGVKDGDAVFVAGHPGSTQRGFTMDNLRSMRDVSLAKRYQRLCRREVELTIFSALGDENERIAREDFLGVQNSRKAVQGFLSSLLDERVLGVKAAEEEHLRSAVDANPQWKAQWGSAWDDIAKAQKIANANRDRFGVLEGMEAIPSRYARIARTIVRLVEERDKPSGERLEEFRDASLPSVEFRLYSPAPIYPVLERNKIECGLISAASILGADDPTIQLFMGGTSPSDRARELVSATTLGDVEVRKKLVQGGKAAIEGSSDPFIKLVLAIDKDARAIRKTLDEQVDTVELAAYDKLTAARFAVYGTSMYPDATFTLRLATGRVAGFDQEGDKVAPFTTFAGMYDRCAARGNKDPFEIPKRWMDAKSKLKLDTPFNFVSTNDIIGGNSGSPVVDAKGEFVGLIFDGNRYSFSWDTVYEGTRGRAVAVDVRGIIEALHKVYGADALADELTAKH